MKPEYYIGIDMIDEEHKKLFKYADEAYELLHDEFTPDKYDRIDIILENLRNYTVKHFSDEEQYMESINYKKIFTQKVKPLKKQRLYFSICGAGGNRTLVQTRKS